MGVTRARQYRCELCGKLELAEREQPPTGWLDANERTACGACVETILRKPVAALAGSIDVSHLPAKDDQNPSFRALSMDRMCIRATALTFAAKMVQKEAKKAWDEAEALAHAPSDSTPVVAEEHTP